MKTNIELVEFAKKALKEDWGYCLGSFGNILTPSFLKQKQSQGGGVGAYNTRHNNYLRKFLNKRVTDCYGLVKAFIWWNNGNVKYVGSQDRNQEGAYKAAKEKGPISSIPEIPGLILWMKGHAGIYIGNGEFIECVGAPVGMRKGKIQNGRVVSGSKFTHWFKDTYISYIKESAPSRNPSISRPTTFKVGDKVRVSSNAKKYATGQTIPSNIKNKTYTIQQVKSDRVLLKEIVSWVFIKDLNSTNKVSKPLVVGSTIKIRGSKYTTGQNIPSWVRNKTHKIGQIKGDRVLISGINSWVNKKDVEVI